ATFLLLVEKASEVRKVDAAASWLHGTARRVCSDLRDRRARRAAAPLPVGTPAPVSDVARAAALRELGTALDEELARLPERYRAPLVLCYLEGRTRDEAARQLGWSLDVLRGRLERGRTALRRRLVRRGLGLSPALLAEAVRPPAAPARAPVALVLTILKHARIIAAGHGAAVGLSAPVAELLRRGSPGMLTVKKKTALALLLATCFAGAAGYATYRSWPGSPEVAWS